MWERLWLSIGYLIRILGIAMVIGGLLMFPFPSLALDMLQKSIYINVYVKPLVAPIVTNDGGATNVEATTARLNGEVTSTGNENPTVIVYYGTSDGGTNSASWSDNYTLGTKPLGTLYYDAGLLSETTLYYYRYYAYNAGGSDWADSSENFTTTVLLDSPTGFTLTDLGSITVSANWTTGIGASYTMIRAGRYTYPGTPDEGELVYYGDATSINSTGYALDTSTYYFSAWGYLSDNVTYSDTVQTASIGGTLMSEIADALVNISGVLTLFHGILLFLPLVCFSVLAFWKENAILFIFTAAISVVTALEAPNLMSGAYATSVLSITVGIVLILYTVFCLGMALKLLFWRGQEE